MTGPSAFTPPPSALATGVHGPKVVEALDNVVFSKPTDDGSPGFKKPGNEEGTGASKGAELSRKLRSGEIELPDSVLYRTTKRGPKGRPYGSPRNPNPPQVDVFNPRVYEMDAGSIRLNSTLHPTNMRQAGPVSQLSNNDLIRFRPGDPISSHGLGPGRSVNVTGGHHRLAEIQRRVRAGILPADTKVRILLHD